MKKLALGIAIVAAFGVSSVGFAAVQKQAMVKLADNMPTQGSTGAVSAVPGAVPPPAGITPSAQPNQPQQATTNQSTGSSAAGTQSTGASSTPIATPNTKPDRKDSAEVKPTNDDDDND